MNATRLTNIPDAEFDRVRDHLDKYTGEEIASGCIPWSGQLDRYGYGKFRLKKFEGRRELGTGAHRIAWMIAKGQIPNLSLVIDHLCRNRSCVNVDHMELVTNQENVLRGATPVANRITLGLPEKRKNKPRADWNRVLCAHGHEWSAENTYVRVTKDGYTQRSCKACSRQRHSDWKARKAA